MFKYLLGLLKNLFNPAVSILTILDSRSEVDRLSRTNRFVKLINTSVGKYTYISNNSWLTNTDIGRFCSVADNVNIGLATHTLNYLSTSPIFTSRRNATGHSWLDSNAKLINECPRTIIGNDVWIGSRVMVMSGIKIGNGAIIGAGAIVTKDVPPYAIVAGVPARLIRYRFDETTINKLENLKWWEKSDEYLKSNIKMFQQPTDEILHMLSNL